VPRLPNRNTTARIYVRPSKQVEGYLQDLAGIGIHGSTPSEVAKKLIENEIERLIREGF